MAPAPATLGFLHARTRAARRIRLAIASTALVAIGSLSTLAMQGLGPASAAGEGSHPGIVRIPPDTALTERAVYPPGVAVGNFDGAYTMATMYKSGVFAGNKVAFWGSEAGALKAGNFPLTSSCMSWRAISSPWMPTARAMNFIRAMHSSSRRAGWEPGT